MFCLLVHSLYFYMFVNIYRERKGNVYIYLLYLYLCACRRKMCKIYACIRHREDFGGDFGYLYLYLIYKDPKMHILWPSSFDKVVVNFINFLFRKWVSFQFYIFKGFKQYIITLI